MSSNNEGSSGDATNATLTRRRQRRPDLQSECAMPEDVCQLICNSLTEMRKLSTSCEDAADTKAMETICESLRVLAVESATPDLQLRAVSRVTGTMRDSTMGSISTSAAGAVAFKDALMQKIVFPMLLDCRVRYLHRALTTLLRTTYSIEPSTLASLQRTFMQSIVHCLPVDEGKQRPCLYPSTAQSTEPYKRGVMHFLNSIDGLTSTLMPLTPSIFHATFVDVLPLLADSLQWVVTNATSRRRRGGVPSLEKEDSVVAAEDDGTVFGEDLEHVRFCVRVVATYIHKYMDSLIPLWESRDADEEGSAVCKEDIARLLHSAFVMLSSHLFPKDVLNAVGLLVASVLTVRSCSEWLLGTVCHYLCDVSSGAEGTVSSEGHVKDLTDVVCAADPRLAANAASSSGCSPNNTASMRILLSATTNNGRFAILKGILAHLSTPVRGDTASMGILLLEAKDGEEVIAYDVILPYAEHFCAAIQEPETRFMAIQTIDSIIRHVAANLSFAVDTLDPEGTVSDGVLFDKNGGGRKRKKLRLDTAASLEDTAALCKSFARFCLPTIKLRHTLQVATQLVMSLWDDGTQQMSGALYSTYNEVLLVNELVKSFCSIMNSKGLASSSVQEGGTIDTKETLAGILAIQNERRGKYHALLGLLAVVPIKEFLDILGHYYSRTSSTPEALCGLVSFSEMLLAGASNHKIGNVAGDVFAKLSRLVYSLDKASPASSQEGWFISGMLKPLASAITVPHYIAATSNVSDAVHVSNTIAHFVTPLLKHDAAYLPFIVDAILAHTTSEKPCLTRIHQGVVEVLYRARGCGVDIAKYLQRDSSSLPVVQASLQALNYDLRSTAFNLCVLSTKKVEAVTAWQCDVTEQYVSLNMHLGGDATARKGLLEAVRKWTRRIAESYKSMESVSKKEEGADANSNNNNNSSIYREMVQSHCQRLAQLCVTHYGASLSASQGLSVERRVAAASCYIILLRAALDAFAAADVVPLFDSRIAKPLIADLSDGWSQARATAKELLLLFAQHAPSAVFADDATVESMREAAYSEIIRAHTYRNAEGAVGRFVFLSTQTPAARARLNGPQRNQEIEGRYAAMDKERAAIVGKIAELTALRGKEAFAWIQANPFHGRLSLYTELLTSVGACSGYQSPLHAAASNQMLLCCCEVIRLNSALVGGESTNTATDPSKEVVDCRGHVYDKDCPEAEAMMRGVVNNTWLSIRVATLAIQRVMSLIKVEELSYDAVRGTCYQLMDALLLTKHNGVMRCCRGSLKTLTEALVRCREAQFYHLPGDMLAYLLGPEGVTSGDVSRMLRRSQGLPHAILSVLESEDPTVPFSLFPVTMKHLLRVAEGSDDESVAEEIQRSQRSNALNVLKFIFEDKMFSERAVAYMEDAFSLATAGFTDASWYIRNSSLMLFSSVLQRFVGEHPSTGGAGVNTSLHDIAKRTPRGVAFAYRELIRGTQDANLHSEETAATSLVGGDVSNLALFPILQMLSMLSPDPPHLMTKATGTEANDAKGIIEAVLRCGASKHLMVRSASAVALVCLVSSVQVGETIDRIGAQRLLPSLPFNEIHGSLLQVQQFITQYVGTLRRHLRHHRLSSYATTAMAEVVIQSATRALLAHRHAVEERAAACPAVATVFFNVVADVLHFGTHHLQAAETAGLVTSASAVVERIVCSPSRLYAATRADHGSAREAASRFLVIALGLAQRDSSKLTPEARASMQKLLTHECSVLNLQRGTHNIVSWMANHLHFYTTQRPVLPSSDAIDILLFVQSALSCDVTSASLRALQAVLAATNAAQPLYCIAWEEVVAHLELAVLLTNDKDRHNSPLLAERLQSLEDVLLPRLSLNSVNPILHTDARSGGIRFLARRCTTHKVLRAELVEMVTLFAQPEQPLVTRHAVIQAMLDVFTAFNAQRDGLSADHGKGVGVLLLTLMRLLLDDTSEIREGACMVCAQVLRHDGEPASPPRDQMSSLLALVVLLQRMQERGIVTAEAVKAYLLLDEEEVEEGTSEVAEDDEDDDVLFQKESDNMFIEDTTLTYLAARIVEGFNFTPEGPEFNPFCKLLQGAHKHKSAIPTVGVL